MKQEIIYILFICLICITLDACQPTPETVAVVNKNQGVLEEKIDQEVSATPLTDIPDNISEVVSTDKYTIAINADVERLKLAAYPVYSIVPADFTQTEVDTVLKYFFNDNPLYARDYARSKSMIKDDIVQIKADLQKMSPEDTDDIESAEYAIKKLEEEYASAPDTVKMTQITSKLTISSGSDFESLLAYADLGYAELSSIMIANKPVLKSMSIILDKSRAFVSSASLIGKNAEGQEMTPDEAKSKAEQALADVGIVDMIAVSTETGMSMDETKQGYVVTFRRSVNGVPVAYNVILKSGKVDMAAEWTGDQIKICLDDEGISAFYWVQKGKVLKETTANVEMLTFDEIMDIARQQLKNKYAWNDTSEKDLSETRAVESIVLQYTCAQQKDHPDNYLLIPAWNFYTSTEEDKIRKNYYCILSLNAVDGSVIG